MKLPFPIRGTDEWDRRERERMVKGCHCLSFGSVDDGQNEWIVWDRVKRERDALSTEEWRRMMEVKIG